MCRDRTEEKRQWYLANKDRISEINKQKYLDNKEYYKEKARVYHLRNKYGITSEQWQEMYDFQEGECDICREPFGKKICVDHDHDTGSVRSLLCSKCNNLLGMSEDSIERLEEAIEYLKKHNRGIQ